jgi:hypothetical protein
MMAPMIFCESSHAQRGPQIEKITGTQYGTLECYDLLRICRIASHTGSKGLAQPKSQLIGSMNQDNNNIPFWRRNKSLAYTLPVLGLALLLFVGNYHLITGFSSMPRVVERDSFSFSEFIIDYESITGMPVLMAKSRYPIGCKVLLREGMVKYPKSWEDM